MPLRRQCATSLPSFGDRVTQPFEMFVPVVCLRIDLADREEDHVAEVPGKHPVTHSSTRMLAPRCLPTSSTTGGCDGSGSPDACASSTSGGLPENSSSSLASCARVYAYWRLIVKHSAITALVTNSDVATR